MFVKRLQVESEFIVPILTVSAAAEWQAAVLGWWCWGKWADTNKGERKEVNWLRSFTSKSQTISTSQNSSLILYFRLIQNFKIF